MIEAKSRSCLYCEATDFVFLVQNGATRINICKANLQRFLDRVKITEHVSVPEFSHQQTFSN